jgi:rRNA-processing protein FCF1
MKKNAAISEMKQLHDRAVFEPIHINEMTQVEKRRAMESLIFLVEKRDGRIKARTCANGSTQRPHTERDEAASPTAITESILITATIDAKLNQDVMTADIPIAFVQTDVDPRHHTKGEQIIMKIRGTLVDMLVEIAPEVYIDFVVYEGNVKTLYIKMLKAIYGMHYATD